MADLPVHIGYWEDFSRSSMLGSTITLQARYGNYLTAALSTFVGLVGTAFWMIVAFIVHQSQAQNSENDVLFFQHQIIYRNQGSAVGTLIDLIISAWNWRTTQQSGPRVKRLKRRTIFRSVPPLLVFFMFTAAGIFVSETAAPSYTSNSVRLEPKRCGYWNFNTASNTGLFAEFQKSVNDTLAGRQYARSCYQSASSSTNCAVYAASRIRYTVTMVDCPFLNDPDGRVPCLPLENKALQLDTGYMDTNDVFGINAQMADRILFRTVTTCAPIRIEAYLDTLQNDVEGHPLWQFNMGGIEHVSSWTYVYPTHAAIDDISYQVRSIGAFQGNVSWTPVAAFAVPNAEISLQFLAHNTVSYDTLVKDIWFAANRFLNFSGSGVDLTVYKPDSFVNVMGCTNQYQICSPNTTPYACTILGGGLDLNLSVPLIGLNTRQIVTAKRFLRLIPWISTYQIVNDLGSNAVFAQDLVQNLISPGLPDDQWETEVRGWFETSLAKLQDYIVQYALNVADLDPYSFVIAPEPNGDAEQQASLHFCSNQRIRNIAGYRSFSFLGLMIVLNVGVTILIVSWILEMTTRRLRVKRGDKRHDYREVARVADHKLQLHRMALIGAGYKDIWNRTLDSNPVTIADQRLPPPTRPTDAGTTDFYYPYRSPAVISAGASAESNISPDTPTEVADSADNSRNTDNDEAAKVVEMEDPVEIIDAAMDPTAADPNELNLAHADIVASNPSRAQEESTIPRVDHTGSSQNNSYHSRVTSLE